MHESLSVKKTLALEPSIPQNGLKCAFSYYDCASLFPERLTLAFIKSAVKHGADVANYCKVDGFLFSGSDGKTVNGVSVVDLPSGRSAEIRGKLVVNCGGPWADLILRAGGDTSSVKRIRRSEGIHIITKKPALRNMIAVITESGKGFCMLPWRGHTLIGPTDKDYIGDPEDFKVTKTAILELIDSANNTLKGNERIEYSDVFHTYGGLRPLVEDKTKTVRNSSRRYEIYDGVKHGRPGLITVEGGKYTTSRSLAQNVMKLVSRKLNLKNTRCFTHRHYLSGCEIKDIGDFIQTLKTANSDFCEKTVDCIGRYYGTESGKVLDLARKNKSLSKTLNEDGEIAAQVVYAIREEMAITLKDILLRRTGIGTLGDPGDETIASVADIAAAELHWNSGRKADEISEIKEFFNLPV